ncbi:hypothetical protein QTQ03_25200 [Micromonospora sp. WMMA1363]|uniref:hypothetical protein n=1 Tax=Micromonospora sp. WMMA1363 TaxID=3053985 RepID=UPI00259CC842|nr:hypothetical protein [Micromonospora sp. WMMA1363]MDM4722732.1 hypothetical protein [Micromonospora sp. WMMA1363]
MGLFSKDLQKTEAIREYKEARRELERVSRGITEETDEYLAANRRVIDAEKHVPWWRR